MTEIKLEYRRMNQENLNKTFNICTMHLIKIFNITNDIKALAYVKDIDKQNEEIRLNWKAWRDTLQDYIIKYYRKLINDFLNLRKCLECMHFNCWYRQSKLWIFRTPDMYLEIKILFEVPKT